MLCYQGMLPGLLEMLVAKALESVYKRTDETQTMKNKFTRHSSSQDSQDNRIKTTSA